MAKKIYSKVIYTNDAVNICYEASKSCYASGLSFDSEVRQRYISARVKEGHSSITEHSNVVYFLRIPKAHANDLVEFLADSLFLHTCLKQSEKNFYLLIGGSALAFNHTIANMQNQFNTILSEIKNLIYESIPLCFYTNLVKTHMMQENRFVDIEVSSIYHKKGDGEIETDNKNTLVNYLHHWKSTDPAHIEFVNVDPIKAIFESVKEYGFTILDILEFCTVTIKFKNMSRIITQQLTRHRNAITQESQRYVDYSKAAFNSPAIYRPDLYDNITKCDITIGGNTMSLTMQELGESLVQIYGKLINQGVKKEDARAFLPGNVQSNLYVTFTYKNLLHFLNLRLDSHAQAEIRYYAEVIAASLFYCEPLYSFFGVTGEREDGDFNGVHDVIDTYMIPKAMYSEIYENNPVSDDTEESVGDPVELIQEVNKTGQFADGEEMPDFGMNGSVPKSNKDVDAEEIYKTYNPEQYASTRVEEK